MLYKNLIGVFSLHGKTLFDKKTRKSVSKSPGGLILTAIFFENIRRYTIVEMNI